MEMMGLMGPVRSQYLPEEKRDKKENDHKKDIEKKKYLHKSYKTNQIYKPTGAC